MVGHSSHTLFPESANGLPCSKAVSAPATISTDKAGPALLLATASDGTAALVGIDADDTVTLTFSEPTNQPTTITGGNIDPRLLASVLTRELVRAQRLVSLRIIGDDRPGLLATVSAVISQALFFDRKASLMPRRASA